MRVPRFSTAAPLLLLGVSLAPVSLGGQAFSPEDFDHYVAEAVDAWGAVGLAVSVVKDGELLFAAGYGTRDLREGGPVDPGTLFAIGSTTKAMTAAALGMLVDEGRLAWDDPVSQYLPGFRLSDPWLTREVTVRDLLTHRAGLGNADFLWYGLETDLDEVLHRFSNAPLAYSPRSAFIYQNIMYAAAGAVVEAVSGLPWEDFLQRRIFDPLGMDETVALLRDIEGRPNVATPHHVVDGDLRPIGNASVDPVKAAGSVWSSVDDMSRWMRMLLDRGEAPDGTRLLRPETVDELFRPQALVTESGFYPTARLTEPRWTTYGLGWFQHDYRGRKIDFHTGSIDGMVAIAGLVRDEGLGVYVLANRDHVEVRHALMYRVFDHFLAPEDVRDWSVELKALYDDLGARADV
ncbi:MAG: beta-lactamase family protein, partial [Gemmatimonadales bacterium]